MSFRWLIPQCVRFDEKDIQKIVGASIRIFRNVEWTIDGTDEFMEYLRNFGCEIRGKKVKFTDKVIDITLECINKEKEKNQQNTRVVEASPEISYFASGQATLCCDVYSKKLRPATSKDLADFSRVVNCFEGLGRSHPTFIPTDAALKTRDVHAYITIMLNSDKPYRVSCYSPEALDYFVEANVIYYGSRKKGIENLLSPAKIWINTPFMISRESVEAGMKLRNLTGKPLNYTSMPVCGIATPVTYDGALALITAEVLGINAISLAIDSSLAGWPVAPLSFDMKNAVHNQWGPETLIISTAGLQIASYLFGYSPEGAAVGDLLYTSAKEPGTQSMTEKAFGMGLAFMCGMRSFGALGTLAFADVGSIVQLILDMELISALKKCAEGFQVSEETIGEEVIKEVAKKGAYFLEQEHTLKYFRKYQWFPELMDRQIPHAWIRNPEDMLENAEKKAIHLVETAPNKCPLQEKQKEELLKLLRIADDKQG